MIEDKKVEYNENLYSRQIGVFGAETMGKLVKLRCFVQGLRGVGIETAKNLILAGPKSVTIYDQDVVQMGDLGSNFYLKEEDVGKKTRAEAAFKELSHLNEYVEVSVHTGEVNTEFVKNFDAVIFTDCYDKEYLIALNEYCRANKIGFIWAGALGLFGWTFVDFGDAHMIFDKDGEECLSTIITSISHDDKGIVTVNDDKRHGFHDGDWVTFREVEGMTQLNEKCFKIKVLSPYSFSIGDTTAFSPYTRQGIAEQTKVPFPVKFKSLAEALVRPLGEGETAMIDADMDWENMGKPYQYNFLMNQLLDWFSVNKRLPGLLDDKDATDFEDLCNKRIEVLKAKMKEESPAGTSNPADQIESLPKHLARRFALFSRVNLSPVAAFWGGIVAQEAVKLTGKYSPIRPWFYYENYSFVLPEEDNIQRTVIENSRYRDQIALIGQEAHNKLENLHIFMVGAGALGCEYMKQFALMGIGCGKGKVEVTDDDNIEISNLNRQFLFRKDHVGKSKAQTSALVAQSMNPSFNAIAHKGRVSPENENIFTDVFWDSLDFVVGAVDNVKARQYVDSKCVFHMKPLFEAGTLGTKCNSQIIIPNITESYGDSQDPSEEAGIPMCTLRNYPYLLDHTIEWGRNYFQQVFVDGSIDFSKYIQNPAKYIKAEQDAAGKKAGSLKEKMEVLKKLYAIIKDGKTNQAFVNFARQIFQDNFHDQIAQLLYCFPRDYRDDKGNLFWSSPKRPPYVIEFDANDEMHFMCIRSICTIMASCFDTKFTATDAEIHDMLGKAVYKVNTSFEKKLKPDGTPLEEASNADDLYIDGLAAELSSVPADTTSKIQPIEFEKDDDSNGHIDFMTCCSNLRARNYKIKEAPRHKIKIIAGKIIPAIATTTALIVGACGIEIYKYLFDKKLEHRRNAFVNLAISLFVFSEPMPAIINNDKEMDPILFVPVKAIPPKWTNWQKLDVKGPNKTVRQVIDYLRSQYKLETSMIILGRVPLYNELQKDHKERLDKTIEELYNQIETTKIYEGKRYIPFVISATTLEGDEANCPIVRYVLN